jgi:DNA-binding NarL/FixJ family response regulator
MSPAKNPAKARIFIVDDHPLVREWLSNLIQKNPDLVVCGEAEDATKALADIAGDEPDLAIVDLSLGGTSGLGLIQTIRSSFPNVGVIVLSMHDEEVYAERCIRAGARGYIMKRETTKKIIEAIREVLKGNLYLSKSMNEQLIQKGLWSDSPNFTPSISHLSDRELEVFRLLGQGYDINEIAKMLDVNMKTVHTYAGRIKEKMKVSTAAELLREALRWKDRLPWIEKSSG